MITGARSVPAAGFCSDIIEGNKIAHTQKGQLCAGQKEEKLWREREGRAWLPPGELDEVGGSRGLLSSPRF